MNVKYIIVPTDNGDISITNPFINGNAWFVEKVNLVNSADAEIKALENTNLKKVAIVNESQFGANFKSRSKNFIVDGTSSISLKVHKPNYIKYTSKNSKEGLAVFSEIYYPKGWNVYVDGNKSSCFRSDYVLRAMFVPSGNHTIEFKFEPQVVKTGSTIALISSIIILLLLVGGIYFKNKSKELKN